MGNGDGTFQPAQMISQSGSNPRAVAVGDLNGDGRADLVVTGYHPANGGEDWAAFGFVEVLLGNGDGTFASSWMDWYVGTDPASVALADLNGDGRLDVVTGEASAGGFAWEPGVAYALLGNGDGTLGPAAGFATGSAPMAVAVADFNADRRPDLATANMDGTVSILVGKGDGTFQAARNFNSGASGASLAVADFNGDGKLDLAMPYAGGSDGDWVSVLLGNGDGTVGPATRYATGFSPAAVAAADFNGDSFADLATANTSATASVLLNDATWPPAGAPTIRIDYGPVSVTEGNTGTRPITFTVRLSGPFGQPVSVWYETADGKSWQGPATAGADYQAASGTLTFGPGETSKTITVLVNGDRLGEVDEIFFVNLTGAVNGYITGSQGQGTIWDDEPRVFVSDVTMAEGQRGQTTLFTFTVALSVAYDQPVTVSYSTANGSAKANLGDYVARSGTLTFAPGETIKTITIEVKGDSKREANETFYLDLFDLSSNALFTKNRGLGTILNDD
jgi:hypothetical protein